MKVETAVKLILNEYRRIFEKYPDEYHSYREDYALIKEELDDLWDVIRDDGERIDLNKAFKVKATQIATLALRFLTCFVKEPCEEERLDV